MSRKFQCRAIPSTWLENNGRRLDCGPYMSGAVEAKELLKKHKTVALADITDDIYHAGRESRVWVESPDYGVPFMGSTDILASDLSYLPLISKKQVASNPRFTIREGWTLITRSGTVGRMAYARSDMDGIACSEHVMRVVPDTTKITPGYLYAYLSSRFGVPMVVSGTYGAIIQHIEPHHIADLPVPRLGAVEDQAHKLIQRAADLRFQGVKAFSEAKSIFDEMLEVRDDDKPLCGLSFSTVNASSLLKRVDAAYHSPSAIRIEGNIRLGAHTSVGEIADVMLPPISSRVMTSEPEYGYPYFTGDALYYWTPEPKGYLARKSPKIETLIVNEEGILVQAFGQTYGLICRPTWIIPSLVGSAVSGLMLRLTSPDKRMLRYLYAFIASRAGQIVTKRLPYGGSIPHMNEGQYREVPVPLFEDSLIDQVSEKIATFINAKTESNVLEEQARTLVERAIEGGGR